MTTLERELETYKDHRDELLGIAAGKWVLIHDSEIAGTFDTQDDAISEGYKQFGNVPFLTKQIVEIETPVFFVSRYLS